MTSDKKFFLRSTQGSQISTCLLTFVAQRLQVFGKSNSNALVGIYFNRLTDMLYTCFIFLRCANLIIFI